MPMVIAPAVGLIAPFLLGHWSTPVAVGLMLATWIAVSVVTGIVDRMRATRGGLRTQPRSWLGMHMAHLGIAVFVTGVTIVSGYETERDVRLSQGDAVSIGGYDLKLVGVKSARGPNYTAQIGDIELSRDGNVLRHLHPEKRSYPASQMPMTEVAIDANGLRHVYAALGESLGDGIWSVRVYHKPFVDWIWIGCILMALGGGLAISDRRYRLKPGRQRAAQSFPEAAS